LLYGKVKNSNLYLQAGFVYAYLAYEYFKTEDKNMPKIEQLLSWLVLVYLVLLPKNTTKMHLKLV